MTKSGVGIGGSRFKRGAGRAGCRLSDPPACRPARGAATGAGRDQTRLARVERT